MNYRDVSEGFNIITIIMIIVIIIIMIMIIMIFMIIVIMIMIIMIITIIGVFYEVLVEVNGGDGGLPHHDDFFLLRNG